MKILNFEISFTDKITKDIFTVERYQKSFTCRRIKQKLFYDKNLNLYDTGMYSVIRTLKQNSDIANKRATVRLLFSVNNVPQIIYWIDKVLAGSDEDLRFTDGKCKFHWRMEKTNYKDSFGNTIYHLDTKMNSVHDHLFLNKVTIEKLMLKMHIEYNDYMQDMLLKA